MSAPIAVPRTVSVTGEGRASVEPDVATLLLGVETADAALATAQTENAERSAALRASLRAVGLPDADIRTVGYQVGQDHGREGPISYRVTNTVRVTERALERVGALLDTAIAAGANRIHRVEFGLRDAGAVREQAREGAMRDAAGKAAQYAALAAARLGPVLAIAEGAVPPRFLHGAGLAPMAASATPIEPSDSTIVVSVLVTYALLPTDPDAESPANALGGN